MPLDSSTFGAERPTYTHKPDAPRDGVYHLRELDGEPTPHTLRRPGSVDNSASELWKLKMMTAMQQIRAALAANPMAYRGNTPAIETEADQALRSGFPQLANDVRAQLATAVTGWIVHKQPLPQHYARQLALAVRAELDAKENTKAKAQQAA